MSPSTAKPRKLVVIDGANAIYRAFFAIPALRAPDGTPTNAVLGFATMLAKILREESPDLIAVAFDPRGGSFRNRVFEGYKAGRDAQPEDLSSQIPLVREVIEAFRIPLIEVPDFEADDVIGTLVARAPDHLPAGGLLAFECGLGQAECIKADVQATGAFAAVLAWPLATRKM